MKSELSNQAPLNSTFRELTPQGHAVAVTTHEALDGYREKTTSIANVGDRTTELGVGPRPAVALDITQCDLSVKSARDEMRRITGSSVSSLALTKIRTGDARRGTRTTRNSCGNCTKRKRRAVATSCMSSRQK